MMMKNVRLRAILVALFAMGALSSYALAMGGFNYHVDVQSGEKKKVGYAYSSQFQGNPIPYTIKPLTSPKHGAVSIERGSTETKIFYQSAKGYVGEDSFQYVRVSDDKFGGTYTVAVTVR
jgi:hypothetical protein